jgi:hypothetical protein
MFYLTRCARARNLVEGILDKLNSGDIPGNGAYRMVIALLETINGNLNRILPQDKIKRIKRDSGQTLNFRKFKNIAILEKMFILYL